MNAQNLISTIASKCLMLMVLGLSLLGTSELSAQCEAQALACNNLVHVSLDTNCIAVITPDVILEDPNADTSQYTVEVRDPDGNIIDTIRQDYDGELLEVRVYCDASGIHCWGYIKVEDKIPPVIDVQPCDTAVTCFLSDFDFDPNNLVTRVSFTDNGCEKPDSLGIVDVEETLFACGDTSRIIERTWMVVDAAGNEASKVQRIYVLRGELSEIEFPRDTIIDCLDEGDISVAKLGEPIVLGCDNFEVFYEDVEIEVCGKARKILRRWRVTDVCAPADTTVTQIIKIEDSNPPTFDFSVFEIPEDRLEAQKVNCLADARDIPNPIITDCNIDQTTLTAFYQLVDEDGNMIGQRFPAVVNDLETFDLLNIPIGEDFRILFVADDGCGNISRDTSDVLNVIDTQPPNAVCEGKTNVTLNEEDGTATVFAETFDDHSFDNCGIVDKQIRRFNEASFSDRLTLTCDDVLNNPVRVVFRVFDAAGLTSDCIVEIFVQDKRPITLDCPDDIAFSCDTPMEEIDSILLAEEPTVGESCGLVALVADIPDYTISDCGEAEFVVTWTATDANGLTSTCTRNVTIGDMTLATVRRPARSRFTLTSCDSGRQPEDIDGSIPEVLNVDCENVAVSFDDRYFFGEADACVKILRKWSIIDWCRFNGGNLNSAIIDSFTQTIVIADNVFPEFVSDVDDVIIPDADRDCEELVTLVARATDDCTPEEEIIYSYSVDMFDDGLQDKAGEGNDATGIYPIGRHRIIFMAEDMCGNIAQENFVFNVRSQAEPIVFLVNNSEVVLGDDGSATLSAASLNLSSSNGCLQTGVISNDEGLSYSFDSEGTELTRTFDCSDIPNGRGELIETRVWVTDSVGNSASTLVVIAVTDTPDEDNPEGVCPDVIGTSVISGFINTESSTLVANVPVRITNLTTGGTTMVETDEYGFYSLEGAMQFEDYSIEPNLEGYQLAGISTLDIVFIQRHILGLTDLDSPFKMVAADVNGSNDISAIDLVELRQLILGRRLELSTDEWKFIDKSYEFDMQDDPFYYSRSIDIIEAGAQEVEHDFVALKVGDVSDNAFEVLAQSRSIEQFKVVADKVGDVVRYAISAPDHGSISGMQMAIALEEDMNVVAIGSDQLRFGDDHFTLTDEELLISWSTGEITNVSDDAILYVDVRVSGDDIPMLQLDNSTLQAEVYNADFKESNIAFVQENNIASTDGFELSQNSPNPFGDATKISFSLPRAGNVQLMITDVNGRTVLNNTGVFQAGENIIDVNINELPGAGVYYYTITSGTQQETKRMIVLQ